MEPRTGPQGKADTLALLNSHKQDAWVASANQNGLAHLVPLSFAWDGLPVVIQAWREENELNGRWIMRGGAWLD